MFEAGRGIILTVLAFGLMVFFHELGHFLAAKLMGVRVDVFAFGFGKRLLGRTWGNTEYKICAIPIGGYVKMAGGDEGEEATGAPDEFVSKTPGQRGIILLAGPVFSVLLGVPMALFMLFAGLDYSVSRVGHMTIGGVAWNAGFHHGDLITSIDGQPTETAEDVNKLVVTGRTDTPIPIVVQRDGKSLTLDVTIPKGEQLGILLGRETTLVKRVARGKPAEQAGIKEGETITHVDGRRLLGWYDFRRHIRPNPGKSVTLTLEGEAGVRTVEVTPEPSPDRWPGFTIALPTTVGSVRKGFPADGKVREGDRILAVDGKPVATWQEVETAILASAPTLSLSVEREGKTADVSLERGSAIRATDSVGIVPRLVYVVSNVEQVTTPAIEPGDVIVEIHSADAADFIKKGGLYTPLDDVLSALATQKSVTVQRGDAKIEIAFEPVDRKIGLVGVEATPEVIHRKLGFGEAILPALRETWGMFTFSFVMIGKLVSRAINPENLMGPLGIIQHTYAAAQRGLSDLFRLVHLITVSIGVFNLIPIPPLDGGRIVMVAYEKIRGKAPSRKFQEVLILSGVGLVLLIFVFATFNDVRRLFGL